MKIVKNSRLYLKILSAAVAVILWFAITYTEDPVINQYLSDINIVFDGEEQLRENGLIVTNKNKLPALAVSIRGTRSSVISSMGSISASVELSGITSAGSNTVEVKYNYPSSSVTLAKVRTREITLETEKLVSRSIPVRIENENADKNEKYVVKSEAHDTSIKVTGAESAVYKISYAKAAVDVTDITKTSSQEYFYKLYDSKGNLIPEDNIIYKSSETVTAENTVYLKKTLPVKAVLTEDMAENYVLNVKSMTIMSVEAGVSENFEISELYAYYDESKKTENGKYELAIDVPEGCYLPKENAVVVADCTLVPKILKEITVSVSAKNVPEGAQVTVLPDKIRITAKGAENVLSEEHIKAFVDVSEIPNGGSAEVIFETDGEIKIIGTHNAEVSIAR